MPAAEAKPDLTPQTGCFVSHCSPLGVLGVRRPPVRRPTPLLSAFGGDDDDDKPRALKKLSYTAEELAAGQVRGYPCCVASYYNSLGYRYLVGITLH